MTSLSSSPPLADDQKEGVVSKSFNFNPKIFEMTHSPIMAPFMIHCVLQLLNKDYGKIIYNPQVIIQFWCGGLDKLIQCLEKTKPTWTELINQVVDNELITLNTPMWTNALIQIYHVDPSALDSRKRLELLVGRWIAAGVLKGMPGPYPSNVEQDCFLGIIGDEISGVLCMYIAEGKFSEVYSFETEEDKNKVNNITNTSSNEQETKEAFSSNPNVSSSSSSSTIPQTDALKLPAMLPGLKGGIQMHFAQKYSSALETDQDKEEKTILRLTSLHPFPMIGPIASNPMPWCCQNPQCQSTIYGVLYTYNAVCWISQQYFGNWCLCDTCCKQYTLSINETTKRKKVASDNKDEQATSDPEPVTPRESNNSNTNNNTSFSSELTEEDKAQGIIRKGWMTKQGGNIKTWKKRFCVLRKDKSLSYYDNEQMKSKQLKGVADFMWAYMIKRVEEVEFHVSTADRVWAFKCKTKEDREIWINAFQYCINRADLVIIDDISDKKLQRQSKADKKMTQEQQKLEKQQKKQTKD